MGAVPRHPSHQQHVHQQILRAADHPVFHGKGGRYLNNELHHLSMTFLRHQKGLMPLFLLGFGGSIFVGWYIVRLATTATDVNWRKVKDDSITDYYQNKQAKFINPGGYDYSTMSDNRPQFKKN